MMILIFIVAVLMLCLLILQVYRIEQQVGRIVKVLEDKE